MEAFTPAQELSQEKKRDFRPDQTRFNDDLVGEFYIDATSAMSLVACS